MRLWGVGMPRRESINRFCSRGWVPGDRSFHGFNFKPRTGDSISGLNFPFPVDLRCRAKPGSSEPPAEHRESG